MKNNQSESNRLVLKNVTLVAVSGIDPRGAIDALKKSMTNIDFHEVVLISHDAPNDLDPRINFKKCKPSELASKDPKNTDDYSKFMLYSLADYITSDFVLIVHNNAYVIHPQKWIDEFLEYDYIGAPWPKNIHYTNEGVNIRVGNGGFSLRSKRLLNILNELNLPFTDNGSGFYHEDGVICVYYRKKLEESGIKYAPVDIAAQFSHELDCPESIKEPFGFHDYKTTSRLALLIKLRKKMKKYLNKKNIKEKIKSVIKKIPFITLFKYGIDKSYIKKIIKNKSPVIIEIGVAHGNDTEEFIKLFNDRNLTIYGFEPEPKNIQILKNKIHNKCFHLFEGVVSDTNGNLTFNRSHTKNPDDLSLSGSIMKPKNHLKIYGHVYFDEKITVPSITLDTFCEKNNIMMIDFVWCDVQGAEAKVIEGGKETFKNKVRYFYTEYCNDEQYENQPQLKKILELLPTFEMVKDFGTDVLLKNKNI